MQRQKRHDIFIGNPRRNSDRFRQRKHGPNTHEHTQNGQLSTLDDVITSSSNNSNSSECEIWTAPAPSFDDHTHFTTTSSEPNTEYIIPVTHCKNSNNTQRITESLRKTINIMIMINLDNTMVSDINTWPSPTTMMQQQPTTINITLDNIQCFDNTNTFFYRIMIGLF